MMKKLLMGLMLLLVSGAASAEWTIANNDDEHILYVDRATIRRNGNFVKMWHLTDYKKAKVFNDKSDLSARSQREYDCKDEKSRILSLATFSGQMAKGTVTFSTSVTQEWEAVPPESINATLWKIACGKK
jgi:hypothetical protein